MGQCQGLVELFPASLAIKPAAGGQPLAVAGQIGSGLLLAHLGTQRGQKVPAHSLDGGDPRQAQLGRGSGGIEDGVKSQHRQCLDLGHRHELDGELSDNPRRSLGAGQGLGHVEAMAIKEVMQPVARDLTWEAPELGLDELGIVLH